MAGVEHETTVYYLDRPDAWGQFGLGTLFLLLPVALTVTLSIPGMFFRLFPNAPRERDPLGMAILGAVALGMIGTGVYFLYTAIRILRDRAAKLEFAPGGIIDHRGQTTVEWHRVVSASFAVERMGSRVKRAVITLAILADSGGTFGVDIDLRGLSQPPEAIFARLKQIQGWV